MDIIKFIIQNWDTIGLLITNILAYLAEAPKTKRAKKNGKTKKT